MKMHEYDRQKHLWEQNTQKPRSRQKDNIKTILRDIQCDILMEYITMCLDSTNKLEHWYVRHNVQHKLP